MTYFRIQHKTISLSPTGSYQLLNKAPCQGKTCQFMSYTRANKTCQGKLGRLCGALMDITYPRCQRAELGQF